MQGLTTAGSIVVIEDDADDLLLFELALKGSPLAKRVVFITEIQEFDNFLNQLAKSPDPLPATFS
jgi:hypothetical protein